MDLLLTAGDLTLVNGDLALVGATGVGADLLNSIAQDVQTRLQMCLGEWFLDTTQGIPWFQKILGQKSTSLPNIVAMLAKVITQTAGIKQLTAGPAWSFDNVARKGTVTFTANTTAGPLVYNSPVLL